MQLIAKGARPVNIEPRAVRKGWRRPRRQEGHHQVLAMGMAAGISSLEA
jgi:hypothetical protein